MPIKLKELFDKSFIKWGLDSQFLMLAEESSELTQATLHCLREAKQKDAYSHLAEEIADTQFMLDEIIYYLKDKKVLVSMINSDNLKMLTSVSFFEAIVFFRTQKEAKLTKMLEGTI